MRVLIITAGYGSGHNVAAESLAAAFARGGATVTVLDHFRDLVHPRFDHVTRALYAAVLRRAPALWGLAYELGDRMTSDSPLAFGVTQLGAPGLRRALAALAPDAVVTVHATPAVVMSSLARQGVRVPPHTTVVTDFVAHSQWLAPGVDRYCVAADEVKHDFVARGIDGDRIVVTGVPVRPEFAAPVDPLSARRALGLDVGRPVVLAMAGAVGSFGRLPDVARALARLPGRPQAVLVAGHDAALAAALRRLVAGTDLRVLEYAADVRRLMAAADLLVTKAGGMTLAEALAAGVPLLAYGSLAGQERRNERFASRAGLALVARSRRALAATLERALAEPDLLEALRANLRRLARPDAAERVAGVVRGVVRRGAAVP